MGGEDEQVPIRGILAVITGEGSVEKIERELKHKLFKGVVWDWRVTAISDKTFLLSFPSKEARRELTKFDGFDLSPSIKVKVEETNRTEESFAELKEVWIKAYGVPRIARKEKEMKELSYLVGEPIEVDETSLRGMGPVRVKVAVCSDEILGSTSIFINKVGYRIRWEPEEMELEQHNPSPKKRKEEKDKENDKDKEENKGPLNNKGEFSKEGEAKTGKEAEPQSAPPKFSAGRQQQLLPMNMDQGTGELIDGKVAAVTQQEKNIGKELIVWEPHMESKEMLGVPTDQSLDMLTQMDVDKIDSLSQNMIESYGAEDEVDYDYSDLEDQEGLISTQKLEGLF